MLKLLTFPEAMNSWLSQNISDNYQSRSMSLKLFLQQEAACATKLHFTSVASISNSANLVANISNISNTSHLSKKMIAQ